jgi:hypothetical protein
VAALNYIDIWLGNSRTEAPGFDGGRISTRYQNLIIALVVLVVLLVATLNYIDICLGNKSTEAIVSLMVQ